MGRDCGSTTVIPLFCVAVNLKLYSATDAFTGYVNVMYPGMGERPEMYVVDVLSEVLGLLPRLLGVGNSCQLLACLELWQCLCWVLLLF